MEFAIGGRKIGPDTPPLVIAEIGINHEGRLEKAIQMIDDASSAGCECVKFQSHVIEDEMIPNSVIPSNAEESIWDIMTRCALSEQEETLAKQHTESKKMIFLSTPFSRAAANRLHRLGVSAFKIGSGECNNFPLVEHIARFGKPVILSTGMNNLDSITKSVKILKNHRIPFALLHCTSVYPTPLEKIRLGAMQQLIECFPDAVIGLSDHSLHNYPSFGAVALGARIIERHFTSDKAWPGPDIPISVDPIGLKDLIDGTLAVYRSLGGSKVILTEEQSTIAFAYACVVSIKDIKAGELLTKENVWVKRPGTGEILAEDLSSILGKTALVDIVKDQQIKWEQIND